MVSYSDHLFLVEVPKYFKALKNFLRYIPEDIYVNLSSLTDILLEYLLTGEAQEELIKRARLAIETADFAGEDLFIDMLREFSPSLLQPLREMLSRQHPRIEKDVYTILQIRAVSSTQTITMRLRCHETNLSSPKLTVGLGDGRAGKRNP